MISLLIAGARAWPLALVLLFSGCSLDTSPIARSRALDPPIAADCAGSGGGGCAPSSAGSGVPPVMLADDGSRCSSDTQCRSAHCGNGRCCSDGDCCQSVADCPATADGNTTTCDASETCQGSRGRPVCDDFRCTTDRSAADDSACDEAVVADDCGFYPAVHCNGQLEQNAPSCPSTCASDGDCDPAGHCDDGACIGDLADGGACNRNAQCQSSHCNAGHCCQSGDCCASAADCPARYGTPPTCDDRTSCQGTRDAPTCIDSMCATALDVEDDSACDASAPAKDCGLAAAVYCDGSVDQDPPTCRVLCGGNDALCDENAYCALLSCSADLVDGSACSRDAQCASDHCQNGHCCALGDCCSDASDCESYAAAAVCDSAATCQGHRIDATCDDSHCGQTTAADDSACAGLVSNACGPYKDIACTSALEQPSDQAALCPDACEDSGDCDNGACAMNECVAGPPG